MTDSLGDSIGLGRTAEVFIWNEGYVLKLFHHGFSLEFIEREAQVARIVHESGISTPAVEDIIQIKGRYGLVYERINGTPMLEILVNKPWAMIKLARVLAKLHASMHGIEAAQDLPTQYQRLSGKILKAERLTSTMKQAALELLQRLPEGNRVCHGDFHPGNVLLIREEAVIIDWNDATRGNPLADVARSLLLIEKAAQPGNPANPKLFGLMRKWFCRVYLMRYLQLRPSDRQELETWFIVNAVGRLGENIPEEQTLLAFVQAKLS